jgi:hypothetical protein
MMDNADLFEENTFEYPALKEAVEEKRRELKWAEEELANFEEDNEGLFAR